MTPQRRPRRRSPGGRTRRQVLLGVLTAGVGGGVGALLWDANAFTSGTVPRNSTVKVADDQNAIVGLSIADSVQRNTRSLLAELTNNGTEPYTLKVSLDDKSQGTLFGPNGRRERTVTLKLDPGVTGSVDIETTEKKGTTIPFTISRSDPDFSFSIDRQTTVEAGNVKGPVTIDQLSNFKADAGDDQWTTQKLRVSSDQYDLDRIELEIVEVDTSTTVATRTYDDGVQGQTFSKTDIVIDPDDGGYNIVKQDEYRLTVTAYDIESNFDQATRTRKAT